MASMSRNNSINSLMGFSVHQPAIGAPLQFFPAMGSQQLDEMIDAYIPGDASILHKRAAVSMEFFQYSLATGDLFKFFMVYPTIGSTSTSPTTNSGSFSGFTTSPVMSERHQASQSPRTVSPSSSKKATSANDFCNLPGMKIMTKDGQDVTNSASRGCKTKEQRDHAHLMRIIKACDSCRRKKTKCDPSHKRSPASTSSGKITKKAARNTHPAAAPPQRAATQASVSPEFDQIMPESAISFDSLFTESLSAPIDALSMDWDQFIQYDEEPTEAIPYDYDFFLDPAGYLSPTTTVSFSSSSTSPSTLPITPIDRDVNLTDNITAGHDHKPLLPYLNPGGLEAGDNYVDFDLYSPQSSFLDEELGFAREVAASPIQSQRLDHRGRRRTDASPEAASSAMVWKSGDDAAHTEPIDWHQQDVTRDVIRDGLYDASNYMHHAPGSAGMADDISHDGLLPQYASRSSHGQAATNYAAGLLIADSAIESVTYERPFGRETIREPSRSRLNYDRGRQQSLVRGRQQSLVRSGQQSLVQHTTASAAAAGLREQQPIPQGNVVCHASGVVHVTHAQSSSPQRSVIRSCGQDGLDIAKRSETSSTPKSSLATQTINSQQLGDGSVSCSRSSRIVLGLNMTQTNLHRIRSTTTAPSNIHEVSSAETPSSSPTVITTWNMRSPAGEQSSWPTSHTLPSTSIIAGVLSSAVPLASPRTTIARRSDLAEDAQPVLPGNVAICTTAVLLLSLALCLASPIIYLLSSGALLIAGGSIHLQRPASHPMAQLQPSDPYLTHKLLPAKHFPVDPIGSIKFLLAGFLHTAQCEITRRLKPWVDSRTPAASKSSCKGCSQKFLGKTAMSRISVAGILV
ncbi:hypothetical protein F5X97DRAFT_93647 [Nemania serpens]|nr:hypothetical protein F5X97DRAFT_93647 [Nemania serpens]